MMFISGGTIPLQFLPGTIQKIAEFLPLTYVVNLVQAAYFQQTLPQTAILVLGGILVVCTVIGARSFRWE